MFRRKKEAPSGESPSSVGNYRIVRKVGEGGMGVVYEATDTRLRRTVAIKMLRAMADDRQRERLWREARIAASVNHPNICQVFEIGEERGDVFIAMEYLEGEPLGARIKRGPIPPRESLELALQILAALDALHRRDIIHRDLKPSNVFLTEHGLKLLDFGLARAWFSGDSTENMEITAPGAIVGTPSYMPPEQWSAGMLTPACDIFSLGVILYEMLVGRLAFRGGSVAEVCRAILDEEPPPLTGGPEVLAIDRILQKALAKDPARRYPDAASMATAIRALREIPGDVVEMPVRKTTRLVVLPFKLLRPDPEIDFLSISLPDAITTSLSSIGSLVIRSAAAATGAGGAELDFATLSEKAGVDAIVSGTLLRAGDQVRVVFQLIEVPSGTVLCSRTFQSPLDDVFRLQDDLAREVVQALAIPLSGDRAPLQRDVPRTAKAYDCYLRANQLGLNLRLLEDARKLYLAALDEDPNYSPAWARLGRVYRVMAKYGKGDAKENYSLAEKAFARALEINPDLTLGHHLLTNLEVEKGRAQEAMIRLIKRAQTHLGQPELFGGLVVACRFCGLLEASAAADRAARRLDPGIRTGVSYTFWMMGDYERALLFDEDDLRAVTVYSLPLLDREAEAIARTQELRRTQLPGLMADVVEVYLASLRGDRSTCADVATSIETSGFQDPEGLYFLARSLARVGELPRALQLLDRVVARGFWCAETMSRDPWLDPLRGDPEFARIVRVAEDKHLGAVVAYGAAGGPALLG